MTGHDALAERLFQRRDRVTLAKCAKRRGVLVGTVSGSTDRVTARTIARKQLFASLELRVLCSQDRRRQAAERASGGQKERSSGHAANKQSSLASSTGGGLPASLDQIFAALITSSM